MLAASALLHVLVVLALLIGIKETRPPPEPLPPPAVSVIFEGGAAQGPSQPVPAPEPDSSAPAAQPAQQQPAAPETPPAPATPPIPEVPPAPEQQALVQPEQPPVPPPPAPLPPAPPRVELVLPRAPQAPAPFEMPELPPAPPPVLRTVPVRPANPRPPPRTAFTPMFRSWSLGQQAPAAQAGLGPNVAGPRQVAGMQIRGAERLGTDWRNALSAWVEAHKYYPQQAIINGEDGSPQVEVVVRRDGKVLSVELEDRSGSQWLDLALQALFRGAQLPPFPGDAKEDQITFNFTMHYILIRR